MKGQGLELPTREAEQRVKRAQRGAEREELLAQLEELASWYRDLVVVAAGAEPPAARIAGARRCSALAPSTSAAATRATRAR